MSNPTNDLAEEIKARGETSIWDLNPCPCCHARADIHQSGDTIQIWCGQWGCRKVSAKTMSDAAKLWNAKDFRDAH